jgi:SAM-dependent methyltransferase
MIRQAITSLAKAFLPPSPPPPSRTTVLSTYFDTVRPPKPTAGIISDLWNNASERNKLESHFQTLSSEPLVNEWIATDTIPIPSVEDREGYYDGRHLSYWFSGLSDYLEMKNQIKDLSRAKTILDFGGASGRVARHFINCHKNIQMLYVADPNINHANFINSHFSENALGIKISSLPYLPFEDSSIDFIYAYSVFTHIDAYEIMWLKELSRVLRPGGHIYITVHDETTWKLLPNIDVYNALKTDLTFAHLFNTSKDLPGERLVFNGAEGVNDFHCNVFYSSSYINSVWSKMFHIARILPQGHAFQTVVIMQKK